MARKEQELPATWEDIPAARRTRFRALEETSRAFEDVPVQELEREVARAVEETREQMRREGREGKAPGKRVPRPA